MTRFKLATRVSSLALAAGLALGSFACTPESSAPPVSEARRLVAEGARLLDVRTPAEFSGGHIPGAVNIPIDDLERRLGELEPKDRPIVVYCQSGVRSADAARILEGAGHARVYDLGGMSDW
jgi:rhodanese-related sulfurtransferase